MYEVTQPLESLASFQHHMHATLLSYHTEGFIGISAGFKGAPVRQHCVDHSPAALVRC